MGKDRYIRDLLFLLFILYFAQGSLYTQGSIISQGSLFLIFVTSAIYFFRTISLKNNDKFFKIWTFLLILNIAGFIFSADFDNSSHIGMLKGILMTALPFYPFYFFARKNLLTSKILLRFFIFLSPIIALQYFHTENILLSQSLTSVDNVVNNISYSFVALIPFVFLLKDKKLLSFSILIVLLFFIIQGGKRGALITGVGGIIVFILYQLKNVDEKNRYRSYFVGFIGIIGMVYLAWYFYNENDFLITRMQRLGEVGGSSGRDMIYKNLFNAWYYSQDMLHLLFGYGFAASLKLSGTGNFAHNDWLELLSNYGLIGITAYLLLFHAAIRLIWSKYLPPEQKWMLAVVIVMWLITTAFSMAYTSMNGFLQSIFLAYIVGNIYQFSKNNMAL